MRILLIGHIGQLGWELHRTLHTYGELTAVSFPEIDLTDPKSILDWVRNEKPSVIVNAAAYTDVDRAEAEPESARLVNAVAPGILAEEAEKLNAALIHFSTDYVFNGRKDTPYTETDLPDPLNVYGVTKLAGEQAIQQVGGAYLIFRTSWVYSCHGGFIQKTLKWARTQDVMKIVDDQISSPTWARMLAEATTQVIAQGRSDVPEYIKEKCGLYHLAGGGAASRYEWAKAILELDPLREEQRVKELLPARSSDFHTPAERPKYSVLSSELCAKVFHLHIPHWKSSLSMMMAY
jgi:dTDP-4-dehydrorhamnose reductase